MRALLATGALAAMLLAGCGEEPSEDPSIPVTGGFPLYGPGPHWIDEVRRGTVTFEAVASVGVDLNADGVGDVTFAVHGPTTVFRSDASVADPSQSRHRNHLDLEIIDMTLAAEGVRFRAGDGTGNFRADGLLFSLGRSDEISDSPSVARDHFEIYFEGEIGAARLHNQQPLLMEATIDRLPPIGNAFTMVGAPLPLLTATVEPAGVQIVSVEYRPKE